jgi:hypothetical protein
VEKLVEKLVATVEVTEGEYRAVRRLYGFGYEKHDAGS